MFLQVNGTKIFYSAGIHTFRVEMTENGTMMLDVMERKSLIFTKDYDVSHAHDSIIDDAGDEVFAVEIDGNEIKFSNIYGFELRIDFDELPESILSKIYANRK